jgi:hypothetical protein
MPQMRCGEGTRRRGGVALFKELKRIESTIQHKNIPELKWASAYCKMRLQISSRNDRKRVRNTSVHGVGPMLKCKHESRPESDTKVADTGGSPAVSS